MDEIKEEKRQKFLQAKGLNKLFRWIKRMQNGKLSVAFNKWVDDLEEYKRQQFLAYITKCALRLQRAYRGHQGRLRFAELLEEKERLRQANAASKLQSRYRGVLGRRKYVQVKHDKAEYDAATMLQARVRGQTVSSRNL